MREDRDMSKTLGQTPRDISWRRKRSRGVYRVQED